MQLFYSNQDEITYIHCEQYFPMVGIHYGIPGSWELQTEYVHYVFIFVYVHMSKRMQTSWQRLILKRCQFSMVFYRLTLLCLLFNIFFLYQCSNKILKLLFPSTTKFLPLVTNFFKKINLGFQMLNGFCKFLPSPAPNKPLLLLANPTSQKA